MEFTNEEKKIMLEALSVLEKVENKNCNFLEWGTVEKEKSIKKLQGIEKLRERLN